MLVCAQKNSQANIGQKQNTMKHADHLDPAWVSPNIFQGHGNAQKQDK